MTVTGFARWQKNMTGMTVAGIDAGSSAPRFHKPGQFSLRGYHCDALFQASNEKQVVVVAGETFGLREAKRQPDFRAVVHEIRAAFHDADNLNASSVEFDALADNRTRPEGGQPEIIRDQYHGLRNGAAARESWTADDAVLTGK